MTDILFLMALSAVIGCSKPSDDTGGESVRKSIELSDSEFEFEYVASSKSVTLTSTVEWEISSSADWLSFSPESGDKGNTEIVVSALENVTKKNRTAEFVVSSGSYKKTFGVTQYLNPNGDGYVVDVPDGYRLVWQDEFQDGRDADGKTPLPDAAKWWYETGNGGWGNNEIQNYVYGFKDSDTCAVISDGILKIIAKKVGDEVLSIRMNSVDSWQYGYFEARLKLPVGKGTWPAFWMMPKNYTAWPDDGEIDIMEEVGYNANYVSSSIHTKSYNHSIGTQKTAEVYNATAQSEFHVYALEWTEENISCYVDGKRHFTFANDKSGNKDTWPFNAPFYLKLNLAWGGNWGGAQGLDESCLPATYEIDYVRVFEKK